MSAAATHERLLTRLAGMLLQFPTVLLSGTRLADELKVSRSSVWQAVEDLRAYGVDITGHPGTGYQLRALPDLLLPQLVLPLLETRAFGRRLHHCFECDSTQARALQAAVRTPPAEAGEVWVAERQTQGRGRLGRTWSSPPAAGIYCSLLLRPAGPPQTVLPLTLMAGLAVADAVAETAGLQPDIRWPNDLLLGGRKFCGILFEIAAEATRIQHAVLGIGLNLRAGELPPELAPIATGLEAHTRQPLSRARVLAAVLKHLERRYAAFGGDPAPLFAEFERRSSFARGRPVQVGELRGVTAGLDAAGFLRLATPDGGVQTIVSGDVRPLD